MSVYFVVDEHQCTGFKFTTLQCHSKGNTAILHDCSKYKKPTTCYIQISSYCGINYNCSTPWILMQYYNEHTLEITLFANILNNSRYFAIEWDRHNWTIIPVPAKTWGIHLNIYVMFVRTEITRNCIFPFFFNFIYVWNTYINKYLKKILIIKSYDAAKNSCSLRTVDLSRRHKSKSKVRADTSYLPVSAINLTTFCNSVLSCSDIILCCRSCRMRR